MAGPTAGKNAPTTARGESGAGAARPEHHERLIPPQGAAAVGSWVVCGRDGRRVKSIGMAWTNAVIRAKLTGSVPHDYSRAAVRNLERSSVGQSVAV